MSVKKIWLTVLNTISAYQSETLFMKDKKIISGLIISIIAMIIDQAIKLLIIKNFELHEEKKVLGDIFTLYYIRNTGSAWGMLSGHTWLLVIVSLLAIFIIGYVYCNLSDKKYTILRVCLALILGGAIGNLIDRIRLKYVVDYLYFKLIDFPVFNFADICVTVPVGLLIILLIFKYNGNDFDVIMGEKIINENGEYIDKKSQKEESKIESQKEESEASE